MQDRYSSDRSPRAPGGPRWPRSRRRRAHLASSFPSDTMRSYSPTPMFEPDSKVLDGRFKVLTVLGRGSATEVYLAEQVSLSRKVVLKVIRPDLGVADG